MLADLKTLVEWKEACLRYRYDITRFMIEALDMTPTWQQDLLLSSIALDGSRTTVSSGHGTGKSASAGVVALWHLLFFDESIMMFTAPSINQLRNIVWKEISKCLARLRNGSLSWLAEYVEIFSEKVYIKGYDKTWHIIAKTASKHNPTTIAGQHGDNYFLWGDEASGIDDKIYDVALGALTHESNRCVLTSQPTRNAGFFYETHHRLKKQNLLNTA